ncbi:MAG: DUF1284 domain-containing protein [Prolixibacteraceae bacterium]|nr:DUF1284 domain-containing protein [Prolixibacteraceae bacterium]
MLRLRPHHILDIVRNIGHGRKMEPHPFGHDVHGITQKIIADVDQPLLLVVGADDICLPCSKLNADQMCVDVLLQCDDKPSKQEYNDALDVRVLNFLNLKEGTQLTVREYLNVVHAKLDGIEKVCTHPKEDENYRLEGLTMGLEKLGITR